MWDDETTIKMNIHKPRIKCYVSNTNVVENIFLISF